MELDIKQLEDQLAYIKKFPADEHDSFAINPCLCLETIYYYLKCGIVKKEAFIALTRFYINHKNIGDSKTHSHNALYLLGIYTLTISKKPAQIIKLIDAISTIYDNSSRDNSGYQFLLKVIRAESLLALNKSTATLALFDEIAHGYNKHKMEFTPFMRASYHLLKLKLTFLTDSVSDAFKEIQLLLHLSDQYGYKLIKLNCLIFILENQTILNTNKDFCKLIHLDFTKLIRESGLRAESFVDRNAIAVDD